MNTKEFKTATPKEKEWCAERYGELDLDNPNLHPKIRKQWMATLYSELLDRHDLPHTPANRKKVKEAYRTCMPCYNCFSKKYRPFVDKGKSKNFGAENLHLLGSLAIHDAQRLHLIKQTIAEAFINADFSALKELDPKLLDIFKESYAPERILPTQQTDAETSDPTDTLADVQREVESIIGETESNEE